MKSLFHEIGPIHFELRGELESCKAAFHSDSPEPELWILQVELRAAAGVPLPEVTLSFPVPMRDVQVRWMPDYPACHHLLPYWWKGGWIPSSLNWNAPVISYFNLEGENRLSYAFSDVQTQVKLHTGPSEQAELINVLSLPPPEKTKREWSFSLRIDRRAVHFSRALADIARWYEEMYPPAPVPEAARLPFYSTWYQFQRDVSAGALELELPELGRCNLRNMILDDGWNCAGPTKPGVFAHCGDWAAAPERFPDMAAHIRRFQERGIRYMLWFPIPFIGVQAERDFHRFQGKYLTPAPTVCGVLDPRFPEVRDYLVGVYEKFVRQWNLDGLKLDFIDSFSIRENDPAQAENFAGRDLHSLPEAVDLLLADIRDRLTAIKPEIMIEFRQRYIGPGMRRYGTIFRAADCAMDLLENRVRTVDLRLLAGSTAVHSDMLIWPPHDTPETAALQIQNVLFSVPQISCRLRDLPESHKRMLSFWMAFCTRHRETLQLGTFRPEHPELSYPLISAIGKEEAITAVYLSSCLVRQIPCQKQIVINATHTEELLLKLDTPAAVTSFNVFGEQQQTCRLKSGIVTISVPPAGFLNLEPAGN